jgi:hypothetical protein
VSAFSIVDVPSFAVGERMAFALRLVNHDMMLSHAVQRPVVLMAKYSFLARTPGNFAQDQRQVRKSVQGKRFACTAACHTFACVKLPIALSIDKHTPFLIVDILK